MSDWGQLFNRRERELQLPRIIGELSTENAAGVPNLIALEQLIDRSRTGFVNLELAKGGSKINVRSGKGTIHPKIASITLQRLHTASDPEAEPLKLFHMFGNRRNTPSKPTETLKLFERAYKKSTDFLEQLLGRPVSQRGGFGGVIWARVNLQKQRAGSATNEEFFKELSSKLINGRSSSILQGIKAIPGTDECCIEFDSASDENGAYKEHGLGNHAQHDLEHLRIGNPDLAIAASLATEATRLTDFSGTDYDRGISFDEMVLDKLEKLITEEALDHETDEKLNRILKKILDMEKGRGLYFKCGDSRAHNFLMHMHELILQIEDPGRTIPITILDSLFKESGAVKRILELLVPKVKS